MLVGLLTCKLLAQGTTLAHSMPRNGSETPGPLVQPSHNCHLTVALGPTILLVVVTQLKSPWKRTFKTVNGLLIPGHYIEQVTSPDILPPDFKNPYLYVPTHLCSLTLCSQLLFPITLMYPHLYIF